MTAPTERDIDEIHTVVVTEMSKNTKMPEHKFWLTIQSKWLVDYSDVVEVEKQAIDTHYRQKFEKLIVSAKPTELDMKDYKETSAVYNQALSEYEANLKEGIQNEWR